ncbi:MAG: FAD/NAD(P)-binding protein [Candidatus Thermoplasmatota archaeon]|nr:FAD/NAD(P)-binding protein [Candidatus Thermoplasmatota archaeon]
MINPYIPEIAKIESIRKETLDINTYKLVFTKEKNFSYKPGQFVMVSVLGEGEFPAAIASSPTQKGYIELSVRKMGKVTTALHRLEENDVIGIRGPYGNSFPVEHWKNKNLLYIGGGIGLAPLRSLINYTLDERKNYNKLLLIYGARTQGDLVYKEELFKLEKSKDIEVKLAIDKHEEGWTRFVGFVPDYVLALKPSTKNAIAITCGPPIMIKLVIQNLLKLGFVQEQIYTTLEMRMKCGIGKCGRCNIGNIYVCKDGPVFTAKQLQELPEEY